MPTKPELLLVDDDPIAIQVLSRMLSGFARLRFARTGQEALRLARDRSPDLMLLDAEMPGMSGSDVLLELRNDKVLSRLPVIVVTSHREPEREAAMFELGAVDFLLKPLSAPQVLARVRAQLRIQRIAEVTERMPPAFEPARSASIMVVDDDVAAIQMIKATLAPLVGQIRFATGGAAALEMMMESAPDLVLLDLRMPGLDGFDVCRAMQEDPVLCQVPIAVITRYADAENEARGLEAGATDFIAKPYQPDVLKARVRNLLRIKHENDVALHALSEHWQRLGEARVTDIVAAASDAILSLDAAGQLMLINAAACALFEVSSERVLGRDVAVALKDCQPLLDWLATQDRDSSGLGAAEAKREAGKIEPLRLSPTQGAERLIEPALFTSGDGDDLIRTLLLHDVTERERAAQAAEARIAAEAASRTKSMMLSYIAHEIGNPLNGILGFAQLMEGDAEHPLHPAQAKRLHNLLASGWHLQSLMRDVMDLSRLESGNFAVELREIDAGEAAQTAIEAVRGQAELAGVDIEAPAPGAPMSVFADALRLQQCLVNLLSNAIKYNQAGGAVKLSLSADAARLHFEVRDTGIGLSDEQCRHLFEPFNRLGRDAGGIRGAGLGLVISQLLAQAMGGALTVQSEPGVGSVFALALARCAAAPD